MPKQKKPELVRLELIKILSDVLDDRGLNITDWPADEAAAYQDNGGFLEGQTAIRQVRAAKAAAAIETVFADAAGAAELRGYLEGIASAQVITGFSDATFRSILDKDGHTRIDLDGQPL